jgi:hypothetical protein
VSEQLVLKQLLGHGGAVERDERLPAARAQVVDGARDDLLTRPGLARHQHRRLERRDGAHLFQQLLHHGRGRDEVLRPETRAPLRDGASPHRPLGGDANRAQQHVQLERLGDKVRRAALHRFDGDVDRAVGGHDDGEDARPHTLTMPQQVEPRHPRQGHVRDHDVERLIPQQLDGGLGGRRAPRVVTLHCRCLQENIPQARVVFDK